MIRKRSYWHGLILGLAAGISFGFLFSFWIDAGTNGGKNFLIYFPAFMGSVLVTLFLGAALGSLPENSAQKPAT
jgi:hypothetical protein